MFNTLKKHIKNEKGLSLVELLAVIVILAIVAAIAIPAIGNIIDNSRYKAVKSDAINVINGANIYFTDTGETSVTVQELIDENYLEDPGNIPTAESNLVAKNATGQAAITTGEIDYNGQNKITFSAATLTQINAHDDKTDTTVGD